MFKKTQITDWSNKQTAGVASVYQEDFKELLITKKNIFKSIRDISESFKQHVVLSAGKETDDHEDIKNVNWSEIATTFVLDNPIWTNNY